jgi:hypothetical protein
MASVGSWERLDGDWMGIEDRGAGAFFVHAGGLTALGAIARCRYILGCARTSLYFQVPYEYCTYLLDALRIYTACINSLYPQRGCCLSFAAELLASSCIPESLSIGTLLQLMALMALIHV